ncbi:MAG TPA: YfhO family protein, partial [bacterium]|nr:YfhO family protein [bacterium]
LAALARIGTLLLEGRRVPLLGIPLGALSAGVQLIPMIRTDGGIDLRDLGPALLGALHLAALVPVLAAAAREYRPLRWWPVLLVPLAALYPWTPAVIAAAAIALAQLRLTPGTAWLPWTVPVLLLASGLAAPATVSLPYSGLKAMVGEVRRMLPAEASPSFAVLQPDHTTLRPAGVYGEPLQAGDFTWSAAWPLLMNLAPDPIAATSVALPWNLAWDDLLRMTHRNLGPPAQVRLGELLQAEYALQALGVSVASWAFPNYPFLDYLPIDPDHPAEAIPAPASEEQRLKELEAEILENLADPNRPVPERPKAFEQQPVGGRHYYRSRGSVPWAVVLYRPSKKLLVDPGAPAERLRLALEALQAETAYPELGPGRVRYVVVAGAADEPAPVVEDRGFTVGTTPQVHPIPHGLDIALAVQAEETPWLMVRLSQADGWSATVNGEEAPLATANGVYLTVPLHEGQRNALVLRYRVPGLTLGLGLTGGGLVAWVVLAITGIAQGGRLWGEAAPRA